jgi:hypothetical protein
MRSMIRAAAVLVASLLAIGILAAQETPPNTLTAADQQAG